MSKRKIEALYYANLDEVDTEDDWEYLEDIVEFAAVWVHSKSGGEISKIIPEENLLEIIQDDYETMREDIVVRQLKERDETRIGIIELDGLPFHTKYFGYDSSEASDA